MKMKYKIALAIIAILILGNIYLGYSYSLWVKSFESNEPNVITSGCFTITFEEKTKSISLKNTYPISDQTALAKIKPYKIQVSNQCDTTDAGYSVTLNTIDLGVDKPKLDDQYLKVAIGLDDTIPTSGTNLNQMEVNNEIENIDVSGTLLTSYIINTGFIPKGTSKTFNIYLWIDEVATNEVKNQFFEASVSVTTYATKMNDLKATIIEAVDNDNIKTSLTNQEYRYRGANPNNYILFNDELWRLIGVVDTPNGPKIKAVKNNSVMGVTQMSNELGNNWNNSGIKYYYENEYYPSLSDEAKNQMESGIWNLGSSNNYQGNGTTINWKEYETGSLVMNGNPTNYEGYIGMLTPSDYGFATNGGSSEMLDTCFATNLTNISSIENCKNNNWLSIGEAMWLMTSSVTDQNNYFIINSNGDLEEQNSTLTALDKPCIFLKESIIVEGGNGTIGNPYRLKK